MNPARPAFFGIKNAYDEVLIITSELCMGDYPLITEKALCNAKKQMMVD